MLESNQIYFQEILNFHEISTSNSSNFILIHSTNASTKISRISRVLSTLSLYHDRNFFNYPYQVQASQESTNSYPSRELLVDADIKFLTKPSRTIQILSQRNHDRNFLSRFHVRFELHTMGLEVTHRWCTFSRSKSDEAYFQGRRSSREHLEPNLERFSKALSPWTDVSHDNVRDRHGYRPTV